MQSNERVKSRKLLNLIIKIFSIIALGASIFAIYEIFLLSSIENLIRYIVIGILILIDIVILFKFKSKKRPKGTYLTFLFFFSLICIGVGIVISYFYGQIDNLNKNKITYTSDLIVMSSNKVKKVEDINNMKIGILSDKKSPEGYIIPKEIIKDNNLEDENQIVEYEDYTSMLVDMYSNEVGAIFVPDSYVSMFSGITGYENIATDVKVIASKDKLMKKAATSKIETASSGKDVTEPFTILLMGIDSTDEVLSKNAIANGDTLILITFNPKTLNATMLSIPRDSYVPIACWSGRPENKITHAAAYGNDCMINTIENYLDVNIDYYAKINFKGLVKLVNAVGGVEVDVPKELCTDDSSRGGVVCIKEGHQTLMGEEALVFARNRKQLANGTFGREAHQQEIIKALINKIKGIKDVTKFIEILNTVSDNLDTNLTTKQILSFYNVAKDIIKKSLSSDEAELINIQQLFLDGDGQMIYDERARMVLWDYVPNKSSRNDIVNAMKINLEQKDHENITEFDFSMNKPYEKKTIGAGYNYGFKYTLLPDFTGDTEAQATATANKLGIKVKFDGFGGTVIEQSYPASKRVDLIKDTLVLKLSGRKKEIKDDECDEKDETCEKKTTDTKDDQKEDTTTKTEEKKEDNDDKKEDE
ncbi:MAG: LCP family protein [Bacilli bacterium]|nr:LCP family protein [Bacilli bacterium]